MLLVSRKGYSRGGRNQLRKAGRKVKMDSCRPPPEQQLLFAPPFGGLLRRGQAICIPGVGHRFREASTPGDCVSQAEFRDGVQSLPGSRKESGWLLSPDFKRRSCGGEETGRMDKRYKRPSVQPCQSSGSLSVGLTPATAPRKPVRRQKGYQDKVGWEQQEGQESLVKGKRQMANKNMVGQAHCLGT